MKVRISNYPRTKPCWQNLWGLWRRERIIKVKIDPWDVWSLDHTLAEVIAPALREYQLKDNRGIPFTDPSDGPPEYANEGEHSQARWEWILDEIVWAFSVYNTDWENEFYHGRADWDFKEIPGTDHLPDGPHYELVKGSGHTLTHDAAGQAKFRDRIDRGLLLFAKYYSNLWI